jgi:hypothetical protein
MTFIEANAHRIVPAAPISITEGLLTVLRYIYVSGSDSGRVRFSVPDRTYRGHRETLKRAEAAGLVRRTVKPNGATFWTLTRDGKRRLQIGEYAPAA